MSQRLVENLPLDRLRPWPRNARTHSRKQVKQIADSIQRFGFTNPVLIDGDDHILAGHGRVAAARQLGMPTAPCLRLDHMTAAEKRAYVLADNKLAINAGWDEELLAIELKELMEADIGFDIGITGFTIAEESIYWWRVWRRKNRETPPPTDCRIPIGFPRGVGQATYGGWGRTGSSAGTRSIRKSSPP